MTFGRRRLKCLARSLDGWLAGGLVGWLARDAGSPLLGRPEQRDGRNQTESVENLAARPAKGLRRAVRVLIRAPQTMAPTEIAGR